jgi:hypothetical protein
MIRGERPADTDVLGERQDVSSGRRVYRLVATQERRTRRTAIDVGRVPDMQDFFAEVFANGIHLTPTRGYLISLVHYACINKESTDGEVSALTTGLTPEQTAIFQRIAWETVKNYKWAGVAAATK